MFIQRTLRLLDFHFRIFKNAALLKEAILYISKLSNNDNNRNKRCDLWASWMNKFQYSYLETNFDLRICIFLLKQKYAFVWTRYWWTLWTIDACGTMYLTNTYAHTYIISLLFITKWHPIIARFLHQLILHCKIYELWRYMPSAQLIFD